jgi:hypothetical protein
MKLGIRTGKARTLGEAAASPGEGSGEHPTLPEQERAPGPALRPEDFALVAVGAPYRPRHAADAAEATVDSGKMPAELRRGRHQL